MALSEITLTLLTQSIQQLNNDVIGFTDIIFALKGP
jgi:hypothetical protein